MTEEKEKKTVCCSKELFPGGVEKSCKNTLSKNTLKKVYFKKIHLQKYIFKKYIFKNTFTRKEKKGEQSVALSSCFLRSAEKILSKQKQESWVSRLTKTFPGYRNISQI